MKKDVPVLNLETVKKFHPGWYKEMQRTGMIGRPTKKAIFGETKPVPAKGQYAMDFAYFVLKSHFSTMDPLAKLILLQDGIESYAEKNGEHPSKADENELRELLGLEPAIALS